MLPRVSYARINVNSPQFGSYLDAEWLFHEVLCGTWEFQMEHQVFRVRRGDWILLPPRVLHLVRSFSRPGRGAVRVTAFEWNDPGALRAPGPYVVRAPKAGQAVAGELFRLLLWEFGREEADNDLVAAGLVAGLLGLYRRHSHCSQSALRSGDTPGWHHVELAVRAIQTNYRDHDLNLTAIARAAEVTPNYLCRVFKNGTGMSVMNCLNSFRIQKAEELLLNSQMNCSEIAEAIGLPGVHRLSHLFRRQKGIPPSEYRRRHGLG